MNGFGISIALCLLLGSAANALKSGEKDFAGWAKHTHAELLSETNSVSPGSTATLALKITLEKNWHTYWINPGDSGTPLRMEFKNGPGVKVARVLWPYPKRFETGPLITFGFQNEMIVPIEVELAPSLRPGTTAHVELNLEWLVCEDVCIPAQDHLSIALPISKIDDVKAGANFAALQKIRQRVPRRDPAQPVELAGDPALKLDFGAVADGYDFVDYFPFRASGATNEAPHVHHTPAKLELTLNRSSVPRADSNRTGVLLLRHSTDRAIEAVQFGDSGWTYSEAAPPSGVQQLGWMILWAFLGGLILNLMPCVFPVLSIKLLGLLKLLEVDPKQVRAQNLAYVAGVMTTFVTIALSLSALRSAGSLVGWGFQLQSPVFLAALVWLFLLLSLNLLGTFEIDVINAGVGGGLTRLKGWTGSFFTGVLAVVVASPCTAPFMGVALGFGLAQPVPALIAIFASLGFGLAFPYVLFAIFPNAIRALPRPGMWMVRVKQVMAVPLLATAAWLVWILIEIRGWPTFAIVLAGGLALVISFGPTRGHWLRWSRQLTLALLILGLIGIARSERKPAAKIAGDDRWEAFTPERLEALHGQPVMVDMTADWCLTCKLNERLVLSDPEVLNLLKERKLTLLKGDWTERSEAITLFLNRFDRVGVPFYVLFSAAHPDGLPLAEVLTKKSFVEQIEREYQKVPGT